MAEITKEMIKDLRQKSGVGLSDCKKALHETEGDVAKAIELLRKKGVAVATKRSGNVTEQGAIEGAVNGNFASLTEVSCETDFSARTPDMKAFVSRAAFCAASDYGFDSVEKLLEQDVDSTNLTVQGHLDDLISKICESIKITKTTTFKTDENGVVNIYVHPDNSMASMVELKANRELSSEEKEKLMPLAKDVCMQVAITNPQAIGPEDIDQELVEKEKEIAKEQMSDKEKSKPAQIQEKMLEGRIRKFYEEVCLKNQKFIKDDKLSVQQKIDSVAKELGIEKLEIARFQRFGINR